MLEVGMKVRWTMPDDLREVLIKQAISMGVRAPVLPMHGDICTITAVEELPEAVVQACPRAVQELGTAAVCLAEMKDCPVRRFPARFVEPVP